MALSERAYQRLGVALSAGGAVLLLACIAQSFWGVTLCAPEPFILVVAGVAFIVCGAALVALTGAETD